MEIISYLKGKKAQKEIKEVHETIGQDGFKHGAKDVADKFNDVDERIGELEHQNKDRLLSEKIEGITKTTAINLNLHNLRVDSGITASKYKHTNMIFDSFKDAGIIDSSKSINISQDPTLGLVKPGTSSSEGTLVMKLEPVKDVSLFVLSGAFSDKNELSVKFSPASIESMVGAEVIGSKIVLKATGKQIDGKALYEKQATVIFNPIVLSQEITLNTIASNFIDAKDVTFYFSSSNDGVNFSAYKEVATGMKIGPHIKLKIELNSSASSAVVTKSAVSDTQSNEFTNAGGTLSLKTDYSYSMEPDEAWTEEGYLLRHTLDRTNFKKVVSLQVTQ